jgi:hypothetical protein
MSSFASTTQSATPTLSSVAAVAAAAGVASAQPSAQPLAQPTASASSVGCRLPDTTTLQTAVKWSIIEDKPIMTDYWVNSLNNEILIGVKKNGEKLLVKSVDEYTSPISKILKHHQDYIIITENSIYLTDSGISAKTIT